MTNLVIMIECPDGDSAESLHRSFKKHTIGYKTCVILESSGNTGIHHWVEVSLSTDLPTGEKNG